MKSILAGSVLLVAATAIAIPTALRARQSIWQPAQGATWNYQIYGGIDESDPNPNRVDVVDIDLFDNDVELIKGLQDAGARVICYFSAGSFEDWRDDWTNHTEGDICSPLIGWEGEDWVNTRSQSVRDVMAARIKLAADKGCDAVEPDNIDAYNNEGGGCGLTSADAIDYVKFLASEARRHSLAIGLKNSLQIVDTLTNDIQFAVNEQCHEYYLDEEAGTTECAMYNNFISTGKPVFHVEYPKDTGDGNSNNLPVDPEKKEEICTDPNADGFSTILKNIDLDSWIEFCDV